MIVKYSCTGCGIYRRCVEVEERTGESVVAWMEGPLATVISADHAARSPQCSSRTMQEVMIPLTGRDAVGGPIVQ